MKNHKQNWNSYSMWDDDKLAVVTLDLGWQGETPVKEIPHLGIVALKLQEYTENGCLSSEERVSITPVEDKIIEHISNSQICEHIAFFTYNGERRLIFYLSNPSIFEDTVDSIMQHINYAYYVQIEENEDWEYYNDFLYPDPYSLQDIHTRTIIDQLEKSGDNFSIPREIDYFAVFENKTDASTFAALVEKEAFHKISIDKNEEGNRYTVEFKKDRIIDFNLLQEDIYQAINIIEEMEVENGAFGGWGCMVVR